MKKWGWFVKKNFLSMGLLLSILLVYFMSSSVSAKEIEKKKLIVGWYGQPGYQEMTEDNKPFGYNYEYLMNIAQQVGWEYEFVICENFSEAYEKLKVGDIDILGYLLYTSQRGEEVVYPQSNSGNVSTCLYVLKDSEVASYEFKAFDGMKVASVVSQNPVYLQEYADNNGFKIDIVYCDNTQQMQELLERKEVDAAIMAGYQETANTRIVASFAPRLFYFALTKDKEHLISDLDYALDTIHLESPFYERDLSFRYLPKLKSSLQLTKAEKQYIEGKKPVIVAYHESWYPLEMKAQDGSFVGIVRDVYERISEITGLKFQYISIPNETGKIPAEVEMVAGLHRDFLNADKEGYELTSSFLNIPLAVVRKKNHGDKMVSKVAVMQHFYRNKRDLPEVEYIYYETFEECLDAVLLGDVDEALMNVYSVENHLNQKQYHSLQSSYLYEENYDLCTGIERTADAELYSIMNKALGLISVADINAMILKNTEINREISITNLIEEMPGSVSLILTILLVCIIFVLVTLIQMQKKYTRRIRDLLYTDELTELWSQKGFEIQAVKLLELNPKCQYYMLDFDINHFGEYNTTNGYLAGNELLLILADIIKRSLSEREACKRIQADHFTVLLNIDTKEEAVMWAEANLREFRRETGRNSLLISYGIYAIEDKEMGVAAMGDCALRAKNTVKGNYEKYIGLYDERLYYRQLECIEVLSNFEKALKNGELCAYYQPKHDMVTGEIVGAEALVRWFTLEGKTIMPNVFIELLETNGLINKLDLYMFEEVCKAIAEFQKISRKLKAISVNISRAHLYDARLVDLLKSAVARYEISPNMVEIEITETAFNDNPVVMIQTVNELHEAGFLVAMDDFGSGFSSLNMLKDIPVDIIKLDRGFLNSNAETERGTQIIKGILLLAQELQLKTVAEGVETGEQVEFLRMHDCDIAQGYYFSKPMPKSDFEQMLKEQE